MADRTTIDEDEVAKFSAIAAEWWDPVGKFRPLHKFNPTRIALIRDRICQHFGLDKNIRRPLEGLRLLDIGCGGGLISEPMTRLGAKVTGLDASEKNIKTAIVHADESGLEIDYRAGTVEALAEAGEPPFDAVLNLEVVEHVADVDLFLGTSATLVKPGGLMAVATINRTLKALATAKIGAEYILRWLPAGTHDPRKFVKPSEIREALEGAGLTFDSALGVNYVPFKDQWRVTADLSVNYMMFATRPSSH